LTGGDSSGAGARAYYITGTNQQDSNVVLINEPTAGYELEVRAINVGAATSTLEGVLVAPIREAVRTDASAIPADPTVTNLDLRSKQVYLYSGNATGAFTLNLRGDDSNTLSDALGLDNSISVTVLVTMGSSLYALSDVKIDGTTQAVKWQNSSKTLQANKLNVISITAIKTANAAGETPATYTVLGSVTAVGVAA
jgi:hypothetical protein